MTTIALVIDSELEPSLRAAGLTTSFVPSPSPHDLQEARLVTLGPDWARIRAWRVAGHRFGVLVVLGEAPPPEERAGLEPLAVVRNVEPAAVGEALAALSQGVAAGTLQLDRGVIDLNRREMAGLDGIVSLTQREADLLAYLAARPHRDVSRDEIQVQVWGHAKATPGRAVDVAIGRLRKKIEVDASQPRHLLTSRGDGYRLVAHAMPPPQRGNLPASPDPFVGREDLLGVMRTVLDQDSRLLTLLGPPGAGKTRAALEAALRLREDGPAGGVWWCELVPARDEIGVAMAVASAVGLTLADTEDPGARIATSLERRGHTVLVLDNAEHVLEAVRSLAGGWLERCSELRILVTSRRRLDLAGEHVLDVPPLTLDEARALFLVRARAIGGLNADTPELDALMERLDRLPLPIELAAARTRSLSVEALAQLLGRRFRLLKREGGTFDPRHASLETAIAWSWDLLDAPDRGSLTALGAFRGRFDAAAAAHVWDVDPIDAADRLDTLLDRSLLRGVGAKMTLLESIRAFVHAHGDPAVVDRARDRHAAWFADIAEVEIARVGASGGREAQNRLAEVVADLEEAWEHLGDRLPVSRTSLALALDAVYQAHATPSRRLTVVENTLAALPEGLPAQASMLHWARGRALFHRRNILEAITAFEEAARLGADAARPDLEGRALVSKAHALMVRADMSAANETATLAIERGDEATRALCSLVQAHSATFLGRPPYGDAKAIWALTPHLDTLLRLERSADAFSAALLLEQMLHNIGDRHGSDEMRRHMLRLQADLPDRQREGMVWMELAKAALNRGEYADTMALTDRGIAVLEEHGRPDALDAAIRTRAMTAVHEGRYALARQDLDRVIAAKQREGSAHGEAYVRIVEAVMLLDQGDREAIPLMLDRLEALVERLEDPLLADSMFMLRAFDAILQNDPSAAQAALDHLEGRPMNGHNQVQCEGLRLVIAAQRDDAEARDRHLDLLSEHLESPALHNREDWRRWALAMRNQDEATLDALARLDTTTHSLIRLLARAVRPQRAVQPVRKQAGGRKTA